MASSLASPLDLGDIDLEHLLPKQTTIDKVGGIFCHICNAIFDNKKKYDTHYVEHKTGGSKITYTCVVCKKLCSSYPSLREHCYGSHVMKNKYQCKHCPKNFCKPSILKGHVAAVHDFKCSFCGEKFIFKKDLDTHKSISHSSIVQGKNAPPYKCLTCGNVIKSVEVCRSHIDDHCDMQYPCPICKEVLPDKLTAIKHLTKHFDEKMPTDLSMEPSYGEDSSIHILGGILCCHCDKLFQNRPDIDAHFMEQHRDKSIVYSCNICRKSFDKYILFGDHCYYHISRDKFQCDQCNKTFRRLSLLVIHTEMFHSECSADKPFCCKQCGYGFMTNLRLKEHMRIVHEEEDCSRTCTKPGCTAVFEKPKDLIQHLKDHNPMLDNWCKQCGLQFTNLSSAEKHLDVHRVKQYTCPVCNRDYGEKYLVVKHIPVHFEAVLHVCKVCGKVYSRRSRLIQHSKCHSENRGHVCPLCSKSFVKPHELKQHLNSHTGQKPYSCTLCPKKFTGYSNWNKHLSRVHSLDKAKITQLNAQFNNEIVGVARDTKSSPRKAESGIESAGSETSDVYAFADSDDSGDEATDGKNWKPHNVFENVIMANENMSITDTVNAAIDRIDSLDDNLDSMASEVNTTLNNEKNAEFNANVDDAIDMKAIVEDIDAMTGEMEVVTQVELTRSVSGLADIAPDVLQYSHMMPVDNAMLTTLSEVMPVAVPSMSYEQPNSLPNQYGPDFTTEPSDLVSDSIGLSLDDHILPHIDPLLTIKPEDNATKYVQNLKNFDYVNVTAPVDYGTQNVWTPPILTKVFQYDENNDANRMYIIY